MLVCAALASTSLTQQVFDHTGKRPTLLTPKSEKIVRISLPPSPPPEPEMSESTSYRCSSRIAGRVVLPSDVAEEKTRLRSGSKWRQQDLALLKVKFDVDEDVELDMLDIEHEWNGNQRVSMILSRWNELTI